MKELPAIFRDTGLRWAWLALVVIVLDQVTKAWASATLGLYQPVPVMPMFNWTLSHNTGAAFSFLHDAGGWQRWFFTVLALGVSAALFVWLRRIARDQVWEPVALSLIIGGALGNVIDRMRFGYVVDFIDWYYKTWHWPAFNVADAAISVGAVMLMISAFRDKPQGETRS